MRVAGGLVRAACERPTAAADAQSGSAAAPPTATGTTDGARRPSDGEGSVEARAEAPADAAGSYTALRHVCERAGVAAEGAGVEAAWAGVRAEMLARLPETVGRVRAAAASHLSRTRMERAERLRWHDPPETARE
eukprot:7384490-Prymnesium_polylepis.1